MVDFIKHNIEVIRERIASAARGSGRRPEDIKLMAVSKFHPLEMMLSASAFVDLLGENRIQEAIRKHQGWPEGNGTQWHLIGHLQRNKARKALEIFSVIETVDTLDLARVLDRILAETDTPSYPVYIEVNMSGELSKEGVEPSEAEYLLERILKYCPRISVEGLMTIGPNTDDTAAIRKSFEGLRIMRDALSRSFGLSLKELSMGMSGDYEIAIGEGSTIVRIGTAIFGPRQ